MTRNARVKIHNATVIMYNEYYTVLLPRRSSCGSIFHTNFHGLNTWLCVTFTDNVNFRVRTDVTVCFCSCTSQRQSTQHDQFSNLAFAGVSITDRLGVHELSMDFGTENDREINGRIDSWRKSIKNNNVFSPSNFLSFP